MKRELKMKREMKDILNVVKETTCKVSKVVVV